MATEVDIGPASSEVRIETDLSSEISIKPRLVVAIDFGTYACGIALQWSTDYEKNCLGSIKVPADGSGSGFCTRKIPTCILLKPDKSVASFGYDADFEFSKNESIAEEKQQPDWKNWYYFRFFKMELYRDQELTPETPIKAVNSKQLPIVEVLAKTISYLKDKAISMIKEDRAVYPEEETKWIITVPAIWSDPAKHVMHEAAEQAGIKSKNLSIALEPECAAIYCAKLPLAQMDIDRDGIKPTSIGAENQTITVVDMGGGTIDITTVEILGDKSMRQVCKSVGGPFGGRKVDEKFESFLRDLIGTDVMDTFIKKHPMAYHDFRMNFEDRKRKFKVTDTEFIIKLPGQLQQLWENAKGKLVDDILADRKDLKEIEFNASSLFFDASVMQRIMQDTVDETLSIITNQVLSDPNLKFVSALLLVGGFAESSFVCHSLRKGLKERNIPVVRPPCPELAVLNGAVLFGHDEMIVSSRVMRYTYGVAMTMEFVEGKHNEAEQYKDGKTLMANNVFRKHVTIGQSVTIGEWVSCKEYYPDKSETSTSVYVFTSDQKDPVHTTEEGCTYIGHFLVDFGKTSTLKKAVNVEFKFGGTELKVRAVTTTNGKTHVKYMKIV